jgi:hypothetical protein
MTDTTLRLGAQINPYLPFGWEVIAQGRDSVLYVDGLQATQPLAYAEGHLFMTDDAYVIGLISGTVEAAWTELQAEYAAEQAKLAAEAAERERIRAEALNAAVRRVTSGRATDSSVD